ncbi:hypothetical protein PRECH8_03350 [Insulibacter thermoxylanivorax]|jgi:hypothetical protein|uniref:Secreted protein n=1 Tax=Insulibacter thermoxylanivorax TaxID=2749268 RepID=A0A916VEW4_9BACL|nr:hypothetical protein [Insulibacter thermoxylanivorax]GFR37039.1 hypothetical protein PRECH8_03350 [Insulibacter thermoxylanivorax]
MFRKRVIVLILAISTLSFLLPSGAFAASNISNLEIDQRIIYPGDDGIVEPQGIKRWIAQQTIKAVAWALRNGGSLIDDIASQLGAKEAKYFTKHLDDIADVLDELAKQSQVLEQTIIDQIAGALYDLGVPLSTARTIANIFTFLAF